MVKLVRVVRWLVTLKILTMWCIHLLSKSFDLLNSYQGIHMVWLGLDDILLGNVFFSGLKYQESEKR